MKNRRDKILSQIKEVVKQTDPTATAILFGSRATGKAKKDSDWDILILVDKATVSFKDEQLLMHNLYDVELENGAAISTLVYTAAEWNTRQSVTPLFEAVEREGIIL